MTIKTTSKATAVILSTQFKTIFFYLQTLRRRDFLCTEDYDEGYFDFHCSHQTPTQGAKWYTICGTPFENRPEYIVVILSISMVAFVVFWNAYFNSSRNSQKSNSASEKKCKHHWFKLKYITFEEMYFLRQEDNCRHCNTNKLNNNKPFGTLFVERFLSHYNHACATWHYYRSTLEVKD